MTSVTTVPAPASEIIRKPLDPNSAQRFFAVTMKLPMELQALVCLRVYGSSSDLLPGKHSEGAFREVVRMICVGE